MPNSSKSCGGGGIWFPVVLSCSGVTCYLIRCKIPLFSQNYSSGHFTLCTHVGHARCSLLSGGVDGGFLLTICWPIFLDGGTKNIWSCHMFVTLDWLAGRIEGYWEETESNYAYTQTYTVHNYSNLIALGNQATSSMRCSRTIRKIVFSSHSKGVTKVWTPSGLMTSEHGHIQREKIISRTKGDKRKPPWKYTQVTKTFLKCECACNTAYKHSCTERWA